MQKTINFRSNLESRRHQYWDIGSWRLILPAMSTEYDSLYNYTFDCILLLSMYNRGLCDIGLHLNIMSQRAKFLNVEPVNNRIPLHPVMANQCMTFLGVIFLSLFSLYPAFQENACFSSNLHLATCKDQSTNTYRTRFTILKERTVQRREYRIPNKEILTVKRQEEKKSISKGTEVRKKL